MVAYERLTRAAVHLRAVLLMKYFFDSYGFTSSGAIAALVQGLLAKELWKRGAPKQLAGARCMPLHA